MGTTVTWLVWAFLVQAPSGGVDVPPESPPPPVATEPSATEVERPAVPAPLLPGAAAPVEKLDERVAGAPGPGTEGRHAVTAPWALARAVSTVLTATGATACGLALASAVPLGFIGAGLGVMATCWIMGANSGGLGGVCLVVLGLIYGLVICLPGWLALGPMSTTGATAGAVLGLLLPHVLVHRLMRVEPWMPRPAEVAWTLGLAVLGLLGAVPGLIVGWGSAAGLVAMAYQLDRHPVDAPAPGDRAVHRWPWPWQVIGVLVPSVWLGAPLVALGALGLPVALMVGVDLWRDLRTE